MGYDWKPGTTGVALGPQVRAGRIAGRWTHPEFPHYWNVAPDGSWKEQHKEGGLEHLGAMHAMDDGGFIVVFGNGFRLRCWPVDENLLAIIVVDPFGKMVSDGLLAERSAN